MNSWISKKFLNNTQRRFRQLQGAAIQLADMELHMLLYIFLASGGGAFQTQGGLFRSNFYPKNHNFTHDFPVIFWYIIHIMLLH